MEQEVGEVYIDTRLQGGEQTVRTVGNINNACKKASKGVEQLGKQSGKSAKTMTKMFLRLTIGLKSAMALIGGFRSIIVDGFKALSQMNEGFNPINESLSRLTSALTRFKNSFAPIFAPLLQIMEPTITKILNWFAELNNAIAMFFARLTGQKTVAQATKVQQNYAKSLNGTAKSAKEAKKQLSSLDKLNVLNSGDKGGTDDTLNPEKYYKMVEVGGKFADLADQIKNAFAPVKKFWDENIAEPIRNFFNEKLEPTFMETLGEMLGFVGDVAERVSPYLEPLWNNVIKPMGEFAGQTFLDFLAAVGKEFSEMSDVMDEKSDKIDNILDGLVKMAELVWLLGFKPLLSFLKGFFLTAIDYADRFFGDIIDVFSGLIDFLLGVFTGDWERAWNGIKTIFGGVWNWILDTFEMVVNGIINGLNAISFDLPEWMGGGSFGLDFATLDLSRFKANTSAVASGAVAPRSASYSSKKKAENAGSIDLSTMRSAFSQAMADSGGNNGDIVVEIDGYEVFRAVKNQEKRNAAMGGSY